MLQHTLAKRETAVGVNAALEAAGEGEPGPSKVGRMIFKTWSAFVCYCQNRAVSMAWLSNRYNDRREQIIPLLARAGLRKDWRRAQVFQG